MDGFVMSDREYFETMGPAIQAEKDPKRKAELMQDLIKRCRQALVSRLLQGVLLAGVFLVLFLGILLNPAQIDMNDFSMRFTVHIIMWIGLVAYYRLAEAVRLALICRKLKKMLGGLQSAV